ncbi:zinc finger BED domain-containing protein RICESLEEPER 2 [Tanacetum coccineum]
MARDLLSVQSSTIASESAFSISGRVLSIRRTRIASASLEMCICLKDHLDAAERIQHISSLDDRLDIEEQLHDVEVETGFAISLSDKEIALDEAVSKARQDVTIGIRVTPELFGVVGQTSSRTMSPQEGGVLRNCLIMGALVKVELVWVTCQEVFTRGHKRKVDGPRDGPPKEEAMRDIWGALLVLESSSRCSSESRRKTHHKPRRISTSEEKNQDQDDGVRLRDDKLFVQICKLESKTCGGLQGMHLSADAIINGYHSQQMPSSADAIISGCPYQWIRITALGLALHGFTDFSGFI